jgi:hypothetical protein
MTMTGAVAVAFRRSIWTPASRASPNLSGEWADDYSLDKLASDLGTTQDDESLDDYATAWETAASDAFWHEVERIARGQLS